MRTAIIIICAIIGLLELMVIVAYFSIFNGNISTNNQDWGLFIQIFNGLIMAILTGVNIYIFYKLNITIENKNQERNIKAKIDNIQSVLTELRVQQYKEIRNLISDIMIELLQENYSLKNLDVLQKKLMEMEQSCLYKDESLGGFSSLNPFINDILDLIKEIIQNPQTSSYESQIEQLKVFLNAVEFYIFGQMLASKEVSNYVLQHKEEVDNTICCMADFTNKIENRNNL